MAVGIISMIIGLYYTHGAEDDAHHQTRFWAYLVAKQCLFSAGGQCQLCSLFVLPHWHGVDGKWHSAGYPKHFCLLYL